MEQLIQDIANLKEQETAFLAQCTLAETEEEERAFTNELNIVRNKLSEKELALEELKQKEQQRAEVIEAKVQDEAIPFAISGIDFTELPAEVITLIDAVVRADRRRLLNEHAIELEQAEQQHEEFARAADDREAQLKRQNDDLQGVANAYVTEVDLLNGRIHQLTLDKQDAESKRDVAVAEMERFRRALDQSNAEIQRLESEVEDYQRAKVFGERQSQQIIDITPEENTNISAALEAVKKLYTKLDDWGSIIKAEKPDGTFELVKREELASEWASVEAPEVTPFRDETEVVAPEVATGVNQFQSETSTDGKLGSDEAADGHDVGVGAESEAVTRAEFEDLKRRVDVLYAVKEGVAA